jgi:hypothetical protein
MRSMLVWVVLCVGALTSTPAFSQSAVLTIEVMQLNSERVGEKPFASVGQFELRRADVRYDKAACPEQSNKEGRLTCRITCDAGSAEVVTLHVIPPQSQVTKTYTVPKAEEVTITGCKVAPEGRRFTYRNPFNLFAESIQGSPLVAQLDTSGPKILLKSLDPSSAKYFAEVASQPDSAKRLEIIRANAALAAKQSALEGDEQNASKFTAYAYGASNAILRQAYSSIEAQPSKLQMIITTGDKADFYRNLDAISKELEAKPSMTAKDLKLKNSIEELKSRPSGVALSKPLLGR